VSKERLLQLWLDALEQPIGVLLRTNDPNRAKQLLYRVRAEAKLDALANLQLRTSPFPDGDLIICHGATPEAKELNL